MSELESEFGKEVKQGVVVMSQETYRRIGF
jgi:hypothetical protein